MLQRLKMQLVEINNEMAKLNQLSNQMNLANADFVEKTRLQLH